MEVPEKQDTIGELAKEHSLRLIYNVIGPIRIMIELFIIFTSFLIADHFLFKIFVALSGDIATRIPLVAWVLDGIEICSILAVGVYFIVSTITGLQGQRTIASQLEKEITKKVE